MYRYSPENIVKFATNRYIHMITMIIRRTLFKDKIKFNLTRDLSTCIINY
jgi:hypothetical protein